MINHGITLCLAHFYPFCFFYVFIVYFVNYEPRLLVTIIANQGQTSLRVQVSTNHVRWRGQTLHDSLTYGLCTRPALSSSTTLSLHPACCRLFLHCYLHSYQQRERIPILDLFFCLINISTSEIYFSCKELQ